MSNKELYIPKFDGLTIYTNNGFENAVVLIQENNGEEDSIIVLTREVLPYVIASLKKLLPSES